MGAHDFKLKKISVCSKTCDYQCLDLYQELYDFFAET